MGLLAHLVFNGASRSLLRCAAPCRILAILQGVRLGNRGFLLQPKCARPGGRQR